ncbi:MAG: hypothetical protein KatS3mg111_1315 [Pirellulaceae bacterium]|nr:MAG: hypothetical protein KatS3mg111_1315 [Pirellulaceae bacterium]
MAHDVNLSEQEVAVELPQAVKESIGEERYELWLGEAQRWKIEGGRLEVTFPNEFAATLATKRVLEDVTRAVEAWRGHRIEVCFAAEARLPVTLANRPIVSPQPFTDRPCSHREEVVVRIGKRHRTVVRGRFANRFTPCYRCC